MGRRPTGACACLVAAAVAGGCGFGPRAIEKTHGRYAEAVRRVEEEQLLRRIVLMRYGESAVQLDVGSIAAQYELTGSAEARPFFVAPNPGSNPFRTFTSVLPDAAVGGANRPTVSLAPETDGASTRRFLTPITLDTLIFLTQSGWPAETLVRVWVERLNGVPNGGTGPGRDDAADPARFVRIAGLFRAAREQELAAFRAEDRVVEVGPPVPAGAVPPAAAVEAAKAGLEYRPRADGAAVLTRTERRLTVRVSPGAEAAPELLELAGLLNLVPGQPRYEVEVAGRGDPDPARFPGPPSAALQVVTRSTAQAACFLANGVEVPAAHAGVARPADPAATAGLFAVRVCGGHKPPPGAFAAVRYRGHWFYLDDADHASKAAFVLLLHLSRLDFARDPLRGPALTLPVGR